MGSVRDFRPVLFIVGILLTTLALAMALPAIADGATSNSDWRVFLAASIFTLFIGICLILANRTHETQLTVRQAFVLTTLSWIVIAAFAALPFAFSDLNLSYADAYFEAMSGLTTTGSTVIVGLDHAPPGILLWRALLQWLGGIGIIVTAIAILPMLRVGGMQLFRTESSDSSGKVLPRAAQISGAIGLIYLLLTISNGIAYWVAGMTPFEAMCHAMTTIATGGYSTSDSSLGYFDNDAIEGIATVYMVLGSLPFVLYLQAVRGNLTELLRDTQVRWFLGLVLFSIVSLAGWQMVTNDAAATDAFREAAFNGISVLTGTGYSTTDFSAWGSFALPVFTVLMFVGGCTGATTGGVKVFRIQVLASTAWVQIQQLIQPHGVFLSKFNRRPIPEGVSGAVMGFFFLFMVSFGVIAMALALMGLDYVTSISGAATALANVGPGLGETIGPSGTFQPLPEPAKWLLSFAMLLGRLELFTVLVLFVPRFWRD
jgi:trk system potassium uptake protein TrkH